MVRLGLEKASIKCVILVLGWSRDYISLVGIGVSRDKWKIRKNTNR